MKKKFLNFLKKDHFFKAISVLASGSLISQIISLMISPILTRLFSPDDFGYYTLVTTAVSILGPIICLKYDMLIVNSNKKEKMNLVVLGSIIALIMSFFLSFFYGILVFKNNFSIYLYVSIFILLLTHGINNLLTSLNNSDSQYTLLSKVSIIKSLVQALMSILFGILNLGSAGIIMAQAISQFSGGFKQSENLRKKKYIYKLISKKKMFNVFISNLNQVLFNAPATLLTTMTYSGINLFISYFYSNKLLGFYSFSYRILGLPFMIISSNFAKIFFKEASEDLKKNGSFISTLKKTVLILCFLIIPFMLLLFVLSPLMFSMIFGKKWIISGIMVQILIPMFTFRLIVDSLTTAYIIKEKQNIEFWIQVVLLTLELICFYLCLVFKLSIYYFLGIISLIYCFLYTVNLMIIFRISLKEKNND